MSSGPIPSALDARTQAFPTLSAAQINRIRALGTVRSVEKGEILFEPWRSHNSLLRSAFRCDGNRTARAEWGTGCRSARARRIYRRNDDDLRAARPVRGR